jgi:hypothetical protein
MACSRGTARLNLPRSIRAQALETPFGGPRPTWFLCNILILRRLRRRMDSHICPILQYTSHSRTCRRHNHNFSSSHRNISNLNRIYIHSKDTHRHDRPPRPAMTVSGHLSIYNNDNHLNQNSNNLKILHHRSNTSLLSPDPYLHPSTKVAPCWLNISLAEARLTHLGRR